MEKLIITTPFQMNTMSASSQLDARAIVETESDIYNIECPHVGLVVYSKSSCKSYVVTELEQY